jgi:hypothetical protein
MFVSEETVAQELRRVLWCLKQQTLHKVRMRRGIKIVGRCLLVLLAIFLAFCTTNEVRQRILVKRSKALLSDIHALHLRRSDWKEAQRLMTRWGKWGHHDGACTPQDCFYVITLSYPIGPDANLPGWASRAKLYPSVFRLLPRQWGGGVYLMQVMFLVQDGVIVRSGTKMEMTISPFAKGVTWQGTTSLIVSVRSRASLGTPEAWEEERRSRHPDYTVWSPGGCSFCDMQRFTYADSMPSEEAAKLSDFQWSCATRWSSCLTLEELNPGARAMPQFDSASVGSPENTTHQPRPAGCAIPLYALGRDVDRIVSVEALDDGINLGEDTDGIVHESSRVRVLAALKGDSPWAIDSILKVLSANSYGKVQKPAHLVKARHYLLMVGKEDLEVQGGVSLENCRIIEDDATSDREVRRGMAMDDQLKGGEPTISLGGFARHSPKTLF